MPFYMVAMAGIIALPSTINIGIFFKFSQAMIAAEIIGCAEVVVAAKGRFICRAHTADRINKTLCLLVAEVMAMVVLVCMFHDIHLPWLDEKKIDTA